MDIERLKFVRHVALDIDGTIYRGSRLFPFTRPFLDGLSRSGIGYTFLTNNSSKSVADYLTHLRGFGIKLADDQLYTSTLATVAYLRDRVPEARRLFVLGTASMAGDLAAAGFDVVTTLPTDRQSVEPDALVVGFDTALRYDRLCAAAWWARRGLPYVASHPDVYCPTDLSTVLVDCGAITACIAHAAGGRRPDAVVGKPEPFMLLNLAEQLGLRPDEILMVGDRLHTDVAMARRAGAVGALVLTGDSRAEDVARSPDKPDVVVPTLAELAELLEAPQGEPAEDPIRLSLQDVSVV